jgi:hypothetical protein
MALRLLRIATMLVALAPAVAVAILSTTDLMHREVVVHAGPAPRASTPIGPFQRGARVRILDAVPLADTTYVLLFPATYHTHPNVSLELCDSSVCEAAQMKIADNMPFRMRIPRSRAAGPLELRINRVSAGTFSLWGIEGVPQWALAREGRWTHALRRAGEHTAACGGPSIVALLGISAFGTCIAAIASVTALLKPLRD